MAPFKAVLFLFFAPESLKNAPPAGELYLSLKGLNKILYGLEGIERRMRKYYKFDFKNIEFDIYDIAEIAEAVTSLNAIWLM